MSIGSEVGTGKMINHALSEGKNVLLPKVCGSELKFFGYYSGMRLETSAFGIPEPPDDESNLYPPDKIGLIFVPGLCFDCEKNRLGYGGGFYDRFLQAHNIKTIAVCFDEQIAANGIIPVCQTDVKIGKIITDRRTIE